jgi:hypothetical protein
MPRWNRKKAVTRPGESYHGVLAKELWGANSAHAPSAERGADGTGDGSGTVRDGQVEKEDSNLGAFRGKVIF